jgi:immune inhibitor A
VRKTIIGLLGVSMAAGVGLAVIPAAMAAAPPGQAAVSAQSGEAVGSDELANPLEDKRRELLQQGLTSVLNGEAKPQQINGSTVVKVGETRGTGFADKTNKSGQDQYVELSSQRNDRVFVILAEFGNTRHPSYPDQDTNPSIPGPLRFDGPLINEIDQPDRAVDNSTVWQADYNADHYRQMYFGNGESLRTYYEAQSSGRFTINGEVTDWVRVQYNEARYGRSNGFPCGSNVCSNTWALVRDAANQWYADQIAAGRTPAEVDADMQSFDVRDRYDYDGDGNFNEPDGYIDHFQIVHAGGDQADGDPFQGEDAIWSHRWYAFVNNAGLTGPPQNPLGGTQIGNSSIWIGDYTIQPENGGRSVFFHEFGHDLGLPDDYNILSGGDNNNEHWTLMAQSRLGAATDEGIGERAGDLGAWNKLQLGWLDYAAVNAGQKVSINLGPQEFNTSKPQAAVVVLPKKSVTTDLGAPFAGAKQYFSGNADDLNTSMTKQLDLTGKASAAVSFQARYGIEAGFDYFYVEASSDGTNFTALDGTVGGVPFSHDGAGRPAIEGHSNGWVPVNVSLNAYAGAPVWLRFHYVTDGGVSEGGLFADAISVTADGSEIFADGAETDAGWSLNGFSVVGATKTELFDHYYIAGHRSYVSYDQYLQTGPYYFGYQNTRPDFVDHYAYQQGLLISYWDTSYGDNDTFAHPGSGRNLYIDAHPQPFLRADGAFWRARVQVYDAPFGLTATDSMTLHHNSQAMTISSRPGQPIFNDTDQYWFASLPNHGVKLPALGVQIKVQDIVGTSMKIKIATVPGP